MFGSIRTGWITAAAFLAILPALARAQSTVGERVRVTYEAERSGIGGIFRGSTSRVAGTLVSDDSAAMVVEAKGRRREVPTASIRRVEVSSGHKRRIGKYTLLGLGSGLLGAATLHFLIAAPLGAELDSHNIGVDLAIIGASGVVGGLLGAAFPEEQWRTVRKR